MKIEIVQVEDQSVAFVRRAVPMTELAGFYELAFGTVGARVAEAGGQVVGAPFGWYHGAPGETADVAGGFPVSDVPPGVLVGGGDDDVEVMVDERIGGRAVVAVHLGDYDGLPQSYLEVEAWMDEQGLVARDDMWEEYVSDPVEGSDPGTWETRIVLPLR